MIIGYFWPLLLPLASLSGFYIGKSEVRRKQRMALNESKVNEKYVRGLNFLLNDKPDKAIDVFIELLDVDSEIVETHLALGSLFRKRGEVDRAIRIHQNLIARPALNLHQRVEALMALGKDYMHAGVLDRAERIFKEIAVLAPKQEGGYLNYLLDIYQQQRAWPQVLEVLSQIQAKSGQDYHQEMAQCYCEMAEDDIRDNRKPQAYQLVKKALQLDKQNVRASLLLGKLESNAGHFQRAIKAYKRVPEQDSAFISEIVEPIADCYKELGDEKGAIKYFQYLLSKNPRSSVIFKIAGYIKNTKGLDEALEYASDELGRHPSIRGLNQLIAWYIDATYGKVREKLQMLYNITNQLVENAPLYRCSSCGLSGKHRRWLCPSCRRWNTVKPIAGIKGD